MLLVAYTLAEPIGIAFGLLIVDFSSTITTIVFSSISGGTFIYIGATEVTAEGFSKGKHLRDFWFYLLGVGVIAVISIISNSVGGGHTH